MEEKHGKRAKILISAYACEPGKGSEPGVGWNWVKEISKYYDIWLLTCEDDSTANLRAYIVKNPQYTNIKIIGIVRRRFGEKIWGHFYYLTYYLWQRKAYKEAVVLNKEIKFDAVHQLNMIGFREPGFLWKLNLPTLWGPVGGHNLFPWKYIYSMGLRGGIRHLVRNILNILQMNLSHRVKMAMRASNIIISATSADQQKILMIHKRNSILLHETGCERSTFKIIPRIFKNKRKLNIVWSGQFQEGKALNIALKTLHIIEKRSPGSVEMQILGTGPLLKNWRALAKTLEIEHLLYWHGHLPLNEALEIMGSADILFFTSLAEATSTVVMEALQNGLPVLCHDTCGFGDVIDSTCGIKIPVISLGKSILYFSTEIFNIINNPEIINILSRGAIQKSKFYLWDIKGNKIKNIYGELLKDIPVHTT